MQTTQDKTLQSLRAMQSFLDANALAIPVVAGSGAKRELDAVIEHLAYQASTQSGNSLGSRAKTQEQHALRASLLKDHMRPIIAFARMFPEGFPPGAFRIPKLNSSPAKLAKAAQDMAQLAAPRAQEFIDMGLPHDFIPQLFAAAQAVVDSVGARTDMKGKQVGSTKGLRETLKGARRLANLLDALTRKEIAGHPALLANWNFVRRLDGGAVRPDDTLQLAPGTPTRMLGSATHFLPPQHAEDLGLDSSLEVQAGPS